MGKKTEFNAKEILHDFKSIVGSATFTAGDITVSVSNNGTEINFSINSTTDTEDLDDVNSMLKELVAYMDFIYGGYAEDK